MKFLPKAVFLAFILGISIVNPVLAQTATPSATVVATTSPTPQATATPTPTPAASKSPTPPPASSNKPAATTTPQKTPQIVTPQNTGVAKTIENLEPDSFPLPHFSLTLGSNSDVEKEAATQKSNKLTLVIIFLIIAGIFFFLYKKGKIRLPGKFGNKWHSATPTTPSPTTAQVEPSSSFSTPFPPIDTPPPSEPITHKFE